MTELVTKYLKEGLEAIVIDKRTSNSRRMSREEEVKFLEQFVELAEAGQIVTVNGILRKFEEETGKESNTSTIYAMLKRHGWRKLKPRPRHPGAASEEEIATSKKTSVKSIERLCWQKTGPTNITSTENISV